MVGGDVVEAVVDAAVVVVVCEAEVKAAGEDEHAAARTAQAVRASGRITRVTHLGQRRPSLEPEM